MHGGYSKRGLIMAEYAIINQFIVNGYYHMICNTIYSMDLQSINDVQNASIKCCNTLLFDKSSQ